MQIHPPRLVPWKVFNFSALDELKTTFFWDFLEIYNWGILPANSDLMRAIGLVISDDFVACVGLLRAGVSQLLSMTPIFSITML